IADLHGDIVDPQLVVFFAGNQFMVVHDLMAAFRQAHPRYQRIFVETLPPGILAKQIESGALVMGNLRIALKPDVYTAGKGAIAEKQKQQDWFADTYDYARNPLAILVAKGNPKHIEGLKDLGRADVRVSMPNPAWEGIAKQIEAGYRKAGLDLFRDAFPRGVRHAHAHVGAAEILQPLDVLGVALGDQDRQRVAR